MLVYFFFIFIVSFNSFLSSDFTFLSIFFKSSSAGKFSGLIPLLSGNPLTSLLFFTCSFAMATSVFKSALRIFTLVSSLAKSLALMVMVGRKSASGLLPGMPSLTFMSKVVLPPNNAWSLTSYSCKPCIVYPFSKN